MSCCRQNCTHARTHARNASLDQHICCCKAEYTAHTGTTIIKKTTSSIIKNYIKHKQKKTSICACEPPSRIAHAKHTSVR